MHANADFLRTKITVQKNLFINCPSLGLMPAAKPLAQIVPVPQKLPGPIFIQIFPG